MAFLSQNLLILNLYYSNHKLSGIRKSLHSLPMLMVYMLITNAVCGCVCVYVVEHVFASKMSDVITQSAITTQYCCICLGDRDKRRIRDDTAVTIIDLKFCA